jgi:hypothetical protein
MTEAIQIPQTTVAELRSLIAKKAGCDEQAVDDVLERFGIEVDSIAPRRPCASLEALHRRLFLLGSRQLPLQGEPAPNEVMGTNSSLSCLHVSLIERSTQWSRICLVALREKAPVS